MARRAQVDEVVEITRATRLAVAADTEIVVTVRGVVLVNRQAGWTWYRFVMGGRWWSLTVAKGRDARQASREAGRLIEAVLERHRRRTRESER